jgi:hypothetical protein
MAVLLAKWSPSDEIGLLEFLAERGSRLGGNTGQTFLRFLGWDGFVTSRDMVACLRDAGLDIAETVTSKRDLARCRRSSTRVGRGDRPALHASVAHLRDVDRRELQYRDAGAIC